MSTKYEFMEDEFESDNIKRCDCCNCPIPLYDYKPGMGQAITSLCNICANMINNDNHEQRNQCFIANQILIATHAFRHDLVKFKANKLND